MATIFPHLTSTGPAPSYREVLHQYRELITQRIDEGTLRPLVLPYHLYGILFLTAYLCIPHTKRPWVYSARWGVLAFMVVWQCKTWFGTSSTNFAVAFAIGLLSVWGIVWSATWLVWCRPQFDAKRVQRRRKVVRREDDGSNVTANTTANGKIGSTQIDGNGKVNGNGELRIRNQTNGYTSKADNGSASPRTTSGKENEEWEYFWQPYPEDDLRERIFWLLDLLLNFRGTGWSWAIPTVPPQRPDIQTQLGEPVDSSSRTGISSTGHKRFDTRQDVFNYRVPKFVVGYFLIDIIKTVIMKDPYFIFGPTTYALPPYMQSLSPAGVKFYRHTLLSLFVVVNLEMVFSLAPIIGCLIYGPSIGLRGEPWYYPTTWGPFSNILDKGLNGLWGGWWHQTFRFAFIAPTQWAIRNGYLGARETKTKFLGLLCAFGISGLLHTGGSISQFPKTFPWHAPIFFMLQALGIVIQMTICTTLRPQIEKFPRWLRRTGNLVFTWVWLYHTCWWLLDDFARGGIWLYEPIPISPMRALGFGVEGDWWWCWSHTGLGWYRGKHWWDSGIAT